RCLALQQYDASPSQLTHEPTQRLSSTTLRQYSSPEEILFAHSKGEKGGLLIED
ncbi:unnamed protein product, partial [Ectocarpus fasciculatus]